jgi:hypothetical protein
MTRGEVWFDEEPDDNPVDWIFHRQRSRPPPKGWCRQTHTRVIELRRTPDELLAAMERRTAEKIIEAEEKEKLACERLDPRDPGCIDAVEAMWNQFAAAHNTPLLDRRWIEGFIQAGALDVTAARDRTGAVLGYHLVFLSARRARQLIAISPFRAVPSVAWRNAVNRANCFLHWRNFLTYRESGIPVFDFGGWHVGKSDIRLLGMNAFKKGFGGRVVQEYECEQPVTPRGWVLLGMARLVDRLKRSPGCSRESSAGEKHELPSDQQKISPALR